MCGSGSYQRPPAYELFFAPLAVVFSPDDYEKVQFAYFASKYGHAKQLREGGERYFDHPKAATWIYIKELNGRDPRVIVDLLLHDISEDTYLLSPYRTSLNFGEEIALDVHALTKLPKGKETIEQYVGRVISRGPWAILTKLCDWLHNLRTLDVCTIEKREKKISETHKYCIPLLIPALNEYGGQWREYSETMKKKILEVVEVFSRPGW